jgi:hypothetical protein
MRGMKAVAKKRTKRKEKILLGKMSAEELLAAHNITPRERRIARAAVDAVMKRRSATK